MLGYQIIWIILTQKYEGKVMYFIDVGVGSKQHSRGNEVKLLTLLITCVLYSVATWDFGHRRNCLPSQYGTDLVIYNIVTRSFDW